ncbi:hypothetical protein FHS55_001818 [Angulomicrobium tetraedrale]|uniref:Uncharacterized protein n=1 Tax=Ancylobacter tetraedralis TaxID=217068 RepID=A0A839Z6A1_9HYPH|nr:hypothetical protein [Ancylobacter tetraedralis]MBB3771219.1 hypothetical protein [Ancylobacter tetraedralis]
MMHPLHAFSLGMRLARLGLDSQIVIAERLSLMSRGDVGAGAEAVRMVSEKMLAAGEVQARLAQAAASGRLEQVGPEIIAMYGRKVGANRRRLARKRPT